MTLLNAYLVSGFIPYSEIRSPELIPSLSGNRPYIVGDNTPSGYADVSSIRNWSRAANQGQLDRDFLFIQNEIGELVAASGWENLRRNEKRQAARWFAVDAERRGQVLTIREQGRDYIDFQRLAREARFNRCVVAFVDIFLHLLPVESQEVRNDFATSGLASSFVEYDIKGTRQGDKEGLFDYMRARNGTSFQNIGLRAKGFVPSGISLNQLVNRTMRVLASGNYSTRNL